MALRDATRDEALGAEIELLKAIPSPGGLGGGSSDAASVLLALNALWETQVPLERLAQLAAALGSDVPYFLSGGTALIAGRGEYVTPLPDAQSLWLVLARPPIAVSTAAVYRALSPADYATSDDTDAIVQAIQQGRAATVRSPLQLARSAGAARLSRDRHDPRCAAHIRRAARAHERERPHPLCPLRRP